MEAFKPIAMRCTQEQFESIKPKLEGLEIIEISDFKICYYLVNNFRGLKNQISNINYELANFNRQVHEEWDEKIFLNACGKTESPQEKVNRLELELELNQAKQELEDSKPKVGQWVISNINNCVFRYIQDRVTDDLEVITDKELIKKLNNLIGEEFVLPEKWCVKDCEEVSLWASKKYNCGNKISDNRYLYIDKNNYAFKLREDYTEITLEQFKKYVLNA